MLVKELRAILEEYDGEIEVVTIDQHREIYDIEDVEIMKKKKEPMLVIKYC